MRREEAKHHGSQARTPVQLPSRARCGKCGLQHVIWATKGQQAGRAGEKRNGEVKEGVTVIAPRLGAVANWGRGGDAELRPW